MAETPSAVVNPSGIYYFSIPVRPLRSEIALEHLDRMSLYNSLYGSLFLLAGFVAILFPFAFSLALEMLLGWILLVGGILTITHFFFVIGTPGTFSFLFLGLLHFGVGFWLLTSPVEGLISLTLIMSAWFVVQGLFKLTLAYSLRGIATWPLVLVSGLLSITLGVLILSLFPSAAEWVLGVIVGADLAFTGISLLCISLLSSWALHMVTESEAPLLATRSTNTPR